MEERAIKEQEREGVGKIEGDVAFKLLKIIIEMKTKLEEISRSEYVRVETVSI